MGNSSGQDVLKRTGVTRGGSVVKLPVSAMCGAGAVLPAIVFAAMCDAGCDAACCDVRCDVRCWLR
jgi:hypothetical protein